MKKQKTITIFLAALLALTIPLFLTHCGGGGNALPPAAATHNNTGKVAAAVTLTGRVADRSLAQTATTTVNITVTISGVYSEDGTEFNPVVAEQTINLQYGAAQIKMIDVPIGFNHLLVVDADWGVSVETVKAIIPEVSEGETEIVTADQASTVLAETAIYYAAQQGIELPDITTEQLNAWAANIGSLSLAGTAYANMTPGDVINFAAPVCGDGTIGVGETCDDGNTVDGDGCTSTCLIEAYCGDGTLDTGETCDDGTSNGTPGMCNLNCDGITSATCGNGTVEAGEACDDGTESSTCNADCSAAACGDSIMNITAGEACDDGNTTTEACAYGQTSCTVCDATCNSAAGATSLCGDGVTDATSGETCDDSNTTTEACAYGQTSCTVCDATCTSAAGATSLCGDGVTDATAGETCDDSNTVTEACAYGQTSCTVCDATCISTAGATSFCGDSITDGTNSEICDDGNVTDGDGCSATCLSDETCGNGITDSFVGESCDDSGESATCNSDCSAAACGDGILNATAGETCDDSTYNGNVGFCNATCNGPCGNGTVDPGEQCDDGNTANGDGCSQFCFFELRGQRYQSCIMNYNYAGGVECWGYNVEGELGDGTNTTRYTAAPVSGLTSGVKQLSSGDYYSCVVTTSGGAKCWGKNPYGNLGDGTGANRNVPVDVSGLTSGVKMISAGQNVTCAVMNTGGVKCWGNNTNGELGDSTFTSSSTPVDVSGITTAVSVQAGANYACALLNTGGVKCWGYNAAYFLGNGSATNSNVPVDVTGLTTGVAAIYTNGGAVTCALTTAGGAKCWGSNASGSLGVGNTSTYTTAQDVSGLTSGVIGLGVGYDAPCALLSTGGVKCWGDNSYGQVGDNSTVNRTAPVDLSGMTTGLTTAPACGIRVCSIRKPDGTLWYWGSNLNGTYGDGTTTDSLVPVQKTP